MFAIGVSCLVACGGGGGGPPSIGTTKDNVCDSIAQVACYDLYQCCAEGEIERDLGIQNPESESDCEQDIQRHCVRSLATFEASLQSNRVKFDGSVLDTCLKALLPPDGECASVDTMLPWTAGCMMSPWSGNVADGAQCFYTYECAGTGPGTSYCAPNQMCAALPTSGMPCSAEGCAASNYCDTTTDTCKPLQGVGGTCTASSQCMKDMFCQFTGGTGPGTCQMLLAGGEACTSSASCESDECFPGTCSGTTVSCYTSSQCNGTCSSGPFVGEFCTTDTSCEGHCSVTTTDTCASSVSCPATESCVLYTCNHPTCDGDIVCAATQVTIDYCTGPESEIGAIE
jgi:hypothetical protein